MSMDIKLRQQAVALTEEIMRTYYCKREIYAVLDHMADDAAWIGPGERERKYSLEDIRAYFELGKDAIPSCEVSDMELRDMELGENLCLVMGSFTVRTTPESKLVLEVHQRVSVTYRLIEGIFKVVHMHISNPYGEMKEEEYFPNEIGSRSYQYLQRLLREKTEVIDMITGNITGGLKGSNDDSTYSYFYVNEGLPGMLDFTYDEFMKKTGGTAVGAVYPPDLPNALEDCARCFAQGPVYSTEYRMQKKDGSLIWVLDSGRKALDAEGVMRINSIVTDITPLKQALFDLEVERERYRIALNNITGSMCEYDIAQDLFMIYQQTEVYGERDVKKLEFPHFSVTVRAGGLVHPEEGEAFLDLCTGKSKENLEFRTCFFQPDAPWRWDQFSCSVICDSAGIPVRSIGMLKDITDEKQKNLKLLNQAQMDGLTQLLNQTAARVAIQEYLLDEDGQTAYKSALLIVDLDRFKEVNDSNGHLYGDEVLKKTARILEDTAGAGSIVGRTGGDEFIILIKDAEAVLPLAKKIVFRVSEICTDSACPISCSIGIAYRTNSEESFSQFFRRADKSLYRAKDGGRNQWAVDGGDSRKR